MMKYVFYCLMLSSIIVFGACGNSGNGSHSQDVVIDAPVEEDVEPQIDEVQNLADESENAQNFRKFYREYIRLSEQSGVKTNRAQQSELSKDLEESRSQAEFWGSIWAEDLERAIEMAELSGDNELSGQYKKELSHVGDILQRLRESAEDEYDNGNDDMDVDIEEDINDIENDVSEF